MTGETQISGPQVPENPSDALLGEARGRKTPAKRRRGAQRTDGVPHPKIVPEHVRMVNSEVMLEGGAINVKTETEGPGGYVPVPVRNPVRSISELEIGERVLLKGAVECEVLGFTENGRATLKTCDPRLMPKGCEEFCADLDMLVKQPGNPRAPKKGA